MSSWVGGGEILDGWKKGEKWKRGKEDDRTVAFSFFDLNLPGSEATCRGRRAWRARELSVGERDC